jgi:hypothetical protein
MPPRPPPTPLLASTPCAIERLPRITRAESIEVPCSQAALAGYRAMVEGTASCDRAFRLLMSAADIVSAANVIGMRSRVARLPAIATAPASAVAARHRYAPLPPRFAIRAARPIERCVAGLQRARIPEGPPAATLRESAWQAG